MRKRENEYEGRLNGDQMCQSKSTKGATPAQIAWLTILSVTSCMLSLLSFFRVFASAIYKLPANDARPLRHP
jgi:hypothetical protein